MIQNGGDFEAGKAADSTLVSSGVETCELCHGPGRTADVKAVHDVDSASSSTSRGGDSDLMRLLASTCGQSLARHWPCSAAGRPARRTFFRSPSEDESAELQPGGRRLLLRLPR